MSYKIFSTNKSLKVSCFYQNGTFENILIFFLSYTNIKFTPIQLSFWFPQKCMCAFSSILILLWQLLHIRESFPSIGNVLTPSTYFGLGITASNLMVKITFIKHLWQNQHQFLNLLNHIHNLKLSQKNTTSHALTRICTNNCIIFLVFSFNVMIFLYNLSTCYSLYQKIVTRDVF